MEGASDARRAATGCALGVLLAACGGPPRWEPAVGAERAMSRSSAALVRQAGITLVVDPEAWTKDPRRLASAVTVLHVRILNDGDEPVAIRYRDFRLVSELDEARRPLPPLALERARLAPSARAPRLHARGFRYAPYYLDAVGGPTACWTAGMALDPYDYDRFSRWREGLPTEPMVRRALPEGVLEPRGWVAGFLYFEPVAHEARRVTLQADFQPPLGAERIASVAIPFARARN